MTLITSPTATSSASACSRALIRRTNKANVIADNPDRMPLLYWVALLARGRTNVARTHSVPLTSEAREPVLLAQLPNNSAVREHSHGCDVADVGY